MKSRFTPFALGLSALAFSVLVHAAPVLDYSARGSYLWTENLGRASGKVDFRDTSSLRGDFAVGTSRALDSGLNGRVQIEASYLSVPDYELLDEGSFGPRAILSKKFGLGPEAPVLAFEAATLGRFARIDENDGVTLQGAVTLSKRFNSLISTQLRGEWQEHVADARTYDVHHVLGEARLTLDPTDRVRVTAGAGRLAGTFTAGASEARFAGALAGALGPRVANYYAAQPTTVTNAFQPGWTAYRVAGDINYYWFEISPAITDSFALALRYERNHATNDAAVEYRQDIVSVSAIYAF